MKTMSLKLEDNLFFDVKKISEIFNMTSSEFVRNAIRKEIEIKQNDFMVRMANVPYCEKKEEDEILEFLNTLTDDDLKVVKREELEL